MVAASAVTVALAAAAAFSVPWQPPPAVVVGESLRRLRVAVNLEEAELLLESQAEVVLLQLSHELSPVKVSSRPGSPSEGGLRPSLLDEAAISSPAFTAGASAADAIGLVGVEQWAALRAPPAAVGPGGGSIHSVLLKPLLMVAAVASASLATAVWVFGMPSFSSLLKPLSAKESRGGEDVTEVCADAPGEEQSSDSVVTSRWAPGGGQRLSPRECWLITLLCIVSAIEGADIVLLPSSMFALQRDLGLHPSQLASMSLWQALTQAAAAPMWGVLADRQILERRSILALGCAGWGIVTALLAVVDGFSGMVALRAVNGVMLASLRPICNGLVPDIVEENRRGAVYGEIQLSLNLGAMVSGLLVTPLSVSTVAGGIDGWRVAFALVGLMSMALGATVVLTMWEPGHIKEHPESDEEGADGGRSKLRSIARTLGQEAARLWGFFHTPTFCLMVLQGMFGTIPWNALGYLTLFMQTAGLGNYQAAFITALGRATQALGSLLGGLLGDFFARRYPEHGRPSVAQVSVLSGIPLVWLLFLGADPGPDAFPLYCSTFALLGLVSTWCAAGTNWPIFTQIVPPESRSAIVAWASALEGISGAVFGNLAVSFLAERCYGFGLEKAKPGFPDREGALALGHALAWSTTGPWLLCLAAYSFMHWSYPRDLRLRHKEAIEAAAANAARLARCASTAI